MLGILPSSFHRSKVAHAMLESRVPVPTSSRGVELLTPNKRLSKAAILFTCALYIVVALEWNGFEFFRHLACKIRNLTKEEEMNDVGLAKECDWNTYTNLLDPLQKKKKAGIRARIANLFRRTSTNEVNKQDGLKEANRYFREKQYEQHHHVAHVSRINQPTYLESLSSKHSSIDPVQVHHEKNYLDSLSDLKATSSTWEDYKMKVDRASKIDSVVKDLREFEKMTGEFDNTIGKDIATQKAAGLVEDEVDSIVYEL
jgi:hypothetical protein